jgi:hypothetical protein
MTGRNRRDSLKITFKREEGPGGIDPHASSTSRPVSWRETCRSPACSLFFLKVLFPSFRPVIAECERDSGSYSRESPGSSIDPYAASASRPVPGSAIRLCRPPLSVSEAAVPGNTTRLRAASIASAGLRCWHPVQQSQAVPPGSGRL